MNTEKIWSEFSLALKNFIFSKVKNETVAKDILQEVFIKIHLHKNELKKKKQLKSWLFSIANNTTIDYFRKKDLVLPSQPENNSTEENSKDSHNPTDCLLPLILALPEKYRKALLLTEIKGIKQQNAADQLGISLPAAKSRIQRGRDLLKKGFINCCDYTIDKNGLLKGEHKNIDECKVCSPN
ncbi:RNA polymerase sigma factor SigZ [Flavicella sp.]|uniref:RNA polymerase sigma factor SigZ n=1 Tax=Flavicella sp. TaxID=2957742 RepID=UPI003017E0CB